MSSTVYVVQQTMKKGPSGLVPAFDLTPALAYGDIELLLDSATSVGIAVKPILRTLRDKLRNFSDDDYILPVGDPIAMALAINVALEYNDGRAKVLRWDRREKGYVKLQVEL